jgi:protoporphyrinogen oxidase
MRLKKNDIIEFVFKIKTEEKIIVNIPISRIMECMEEEAYEIVTNVDCNDSSCAVLGFCECNPRNEDAELQYLELIKSL